MCTWTIVSNQKRNVSQIMCTNQAFTKLPSFPSRDIRNSVITRSNRNLLSHAFPLRILSLLATFSSPHGTGPQRREAGSAVLVND